MAVTGYTAPGSTTLHIPLDTEDLAHPVLSTLCGVDVPGTWRTDATGPAHTCGACIRVRAAQERITRPWQEGETQHYTCRRHPGLETFYRDDIGVCAWNLAGSELHFQAVTDEHPGRRTGRPVRLTVGYFPEDTIGYFPDVDTAIRFLLDIQQAGRLGHLMAHIYTPGWDPATSPAAFVT